MAIKPLGIVFDARNVPELAEFWRQATGYEITKLGERYLTSRRRERASDTF